MKLDEDMDSFMIEIAKLLDNEIPKHRQNLRDNVINLEQVAQYCEDIYVNSRDADKQHLLNETKGYTAQSFLIR